MAKNIKVTLDIEVPDNATEQDITEWVDVTLCGWNSMKQENPCLRDSEVIDGDWEYY